MEHINKLSILLYCFCMYMVNSRGIAGNVKLVAMNGNQYWFSSSSPYAPSLNYHLAYQYCRTLGLQLVVLETKEEVETISAYLNSVDGSNLNLNKYWTSGNRLGAESWIWMSNGEQLNSSFSDYWLKSGNGSPSDNPKQCMSMKAPITKRAIFTADECNKSYPFICEQVRCLYYNYPVMLFPEPSDLRSDLEEGGTLATPAESESRSSSTYLPGEKTRLQHFISGRHINNINSNTTPTTLSDIAALESGKIDPSQIQRRITLRPVMSNYPYPPSYINSFYKYKTVDYTQTNTDRPSFKKTTRETLWSPSSAIVDEPTTIATSPSVSSSSTLIAILKAKSQNLQNTKTKGITYITGKVLKPSNSSVETTIRTSVSKEQNVPSGAYTHLQIVTSKSTHIDGEEVTESGDEAEEEATTLYFKRYGVENGNNAQSEYISTNPTIIYDDEQNNVGGEVEIQDETESPNYSKDAFFQGNGIRRPDTQSVTTFKSRGSSEEEAATTTRIFSGEKDREASQVHSPATMKMYQFQRNKAPISWSNRNKGGRSLGAITASTNTGPSKIGLAPRLKFRIKN